MCVEAQNIGFFYPEHFAMPDAIYNMWFGGGRVLGNLLVDGFFFVLNTFNQILNVV